MRGLLQLLSGEFHRRLLGNAGLLQKLVEQFNKQFKVFFLIVLFKQSEQFKFAIIQQQFLQ